jgi:hypothetical protein
MSYSINNYGDFAHSLALSNPRAPARSAVQAEKMRASVHYFRDYGRSSPRTPIIYNLLHDVPMGRFTLVTLNRRMVLQQFVTLL